MIASKLLFSVKNGGSSTQEDHTTIQFEVGEPEKIGELTNHAYLAVTIFFNVTI